MKKLDLNNKKSANTILILFVLFIISTVYFTNIFKSNDQNNSKVIQRTKAIPSDYLNRIAKIQFKNKNGSFHFEKNANNQVSPWQMTEPRNITANSVFFDKIFSFLSTYQVKKIYPNDKINNSNFSLEKPLAMFDFFLDDGRFIHVDIGLNNTIDNSIYIKSNLVNGILHLDTPGVSLENATLLDLIESQIFNFDLDNLTHIKIFKAKKNSEPIFDIIKKDNNWFSKDEKHINNAKLDDFIEEISLLKSSYILDKQTDSQKRQISSLKKNSEYILTVEDNKKNTIEYQISGVFRDMPEVDLKSEPHFLITTNHNQTAYLIKKEFFTLFDMKTEKVIDTESPAKN